MKHRNPASRSKAGRKDATPSPRSQKKTSSAFTEVELSQIAQKATLPYGVLISNCDRWQGRSYMRKRLSTQGEFVEELRLAVPDCGVIAKRYTDAARIFLSVILDQGPGYCWRMDTLQRRAGVGRQVREEILRILCRAGYAIRVTQYRGGQSFLTTYCFRDYPSQQWAKSYLEGIRTDQLKSGSELANQSGLRNAIREPTTKLKVGDNLQWLMEVVSTAFPDRSVTPAAMVAARRMHKHGRWCAAAVQHMMLAQALRSNSIKAEDERLVGWQSPDEWIESRARDFHATKPIDERDAHKLKNCLDEDERYASSRDLYELYRMFVVDELELMVESLRQEDSTLEGFLVRTRLFSRAKWLVKSPVIRNLEDSISRSAEGLTISDLQGFWSEALELAQSQASPLKGTWFQVHELEDWGHPNFSQLEEFRAQTRKDKSVDSNKPTYIDGLEEVSVSAKDEVSQEMDEFFGSLRKLSTDEERLNYIRGLMTPAPAWLRIVTHPHDEEIRNRFLEQALRELDSPQKRSVLEMLAFDLSIFNVDWTAKPDMSTL